MDPTRWQRAEALFLETADLPPKVRDERLTLIAESDPELAATVRRMLDADAATGSVLDRTPTGLLTAETGGAQPDDLPDRVGRYEILGLLGRGGMGSVYLARRTDRTFDREVALKVLPAAVDPARTARRFDAEVRVLSRLEHPNIARLYDAGVEGGYAWLAMERVRGRRIDVYSDDEGLGLGARIALFLEVCAAVQHAHQNLVVHRDLKPSNILVSDRGPVKLLDFGIATLLDPDDDAGGETETRLRAMTVEYASPEQVQGLPVTTASDVYSLGVVLYELLTGERPYAVGPTLAQAVRAVVESDPVRPSVRAPAVGGDLEAILLKALSKDPGERYSSAQVLMDDVRRYVDGRPVHARPITAGYRLRRFVRRNRLGVGAAAVVTLALVGGLGLATWQASVAQRQRDLARVEAEKAARVTDFLIDVFQVSDPEEARADTLTAAQILDRGAARVEASLAADPELQATLFDVIGRVYRSLSLYDQADSLLSRGLAIRRDRLGPEHPDVVESLHSLATLAFARDDPGADSLYDRVVALRRLEAETAPQHLAESLVGRAFAKLGRDDDGAEADLDEALTLYALADPADSARVASAFYARGFLRHSQARYEEAETLYRRALRLQRSSLGEAHPTTLVTLSNLGSLLRLLGRYEAADSAVQRVYEARLEVFGSRHARVANALFGLAELAYQRGDYAAAEARVREALAMRADLYGPEHQRVTFTRFFLARVLQAQGDVAAARELLEEVMEAVPEGVGGDGLARMLNAYAGNLEARGDLEGAESFYRRAWEAYAEASGPEHPFTAMVQGNIGSVLLDRGDHAGARVELTEARRLLEGAYGPSHRSVGVVRLKAGTIDLLEGDAERAEAEMRAALGILEGALPSGHWWIGQARLRLGAAVADQERWDEARALLLESRIILEPQRRARVGDWRQLLSELYEVALAQGRDEEAAGYQEEFRETDAWLPRGDGAA